MAKKPRAKKEKNPATAALLNALKFIEPASREFGQINQTHCVLSNNWAVAFDGITCLAAKIDTDIVAYPNTKRLIAALSKCDETTQITQLDYNRLAIKSGKFSAFVPCLDPGLIQISPPDNPTYPVDEKVIAALEVVGKIAKENAPRMVQASVLLRNGSAVATDGNIIFESWHGWQLPSCILPKVFVSELIKLKKKPVTLGVSENTCTFWFEDGSLARSQLYTERYPDVDAILNTGGVSMSPIPEGFFAALDKIEVLQDERSGTVLFTDKGLRTHEGEGVGASYELEGLPPDLSFNLDLLRLFAPHALTVDFNAAMPNNNRAAVFYGSNFRGLLAHMRRPKELPDDDIPY